LTSVSSISTTIESKSERVVENLTAAAPLDKAGLIQTRTTFSRRVPQFLRRSWIARQKSLGALLQLLRKIFPFQHKPRRQWREARVVCARSLHKRAPRVQPLARRRAAQDLSGSRTTTPVRSAILMNRGLPQASQPIAHAHSEA